MSKLTLELIENVSEQCEHIAQAMGYQSAAPLLNPRLTYPNMRPTGVDDNSLQYASDVRSLLVWRRKALAHVIALDLPEIGDGTAPGEPVIVVLPEFKRFSDDPEFWALATQYRQRQEQRRWD